MTTKGFASPTAVSDEIRPEELTELVERLHRREERLSIGDVAETLGVAPEAVEATLRAMRSERMPSVVAHKRPRRKIVVALAGLLGLGVILAFGQIRYEQGETSGRLGAFRWQRNNSQPFSGRSGSDAELGERLRTALPQGVTVRIGEVAYTGRPGEVSGSESEITELVSVAIERQSVDVKSGSDNGPGALRQIQTAAAASLTRSANTSPPSTRGLDWVPITVSSQGKAWITYAPRLDGTVHLPFDWYSSFQETRSRIAEIVANVVVQRGDIESPGKAPNAVPRQMRPQ